VAQAFDISPHDGAVGLTSLLKQRFGWAPAEAFYVMGQKVLPTVINVETGIGETKEAVWGKFSLPGTDEGSLMTGTAVNSKGQKVLKITATVFRKDEETVQAFFAMAREFFAQNSIYRGKAIRVSFRDADGEQRDVPQVQFWDASYDENMMIYASTVHEAIDTNLLTPISRIHDVLANGMPFKRGVLLGGTYGTGKTLAARVAGKRSIEAGLTFIYIGRADELHDAIRFAEMYQNPGSVIFCEDIDRVTEGERSVSMDDILNVLDGIDSKSSNIMTVLTTNELEKIHQAMLRPGRLDAVIEVTKPDAIAIDRLIRAYGKGSIAPTEDLTMACDLLAGCIPAVVAEVVKRAKLVQLKHTPVGEQIRNITGESLAEAASTMHRQLALLEPKVEEPMDPLVTQLKRVFAEAMDEKVSELEGKMDIGVKQGKRLNKAVLG
jgi:transitional endoplasmic reticulum ATPase